MILHFPYLLFHKKDPKVSLDNVSSFTSYSKYDSYRLGSIVNLKVNGAYDDYQISSLEKGDFKVKYSGIEVSSLSHILNADISYGSFLIQNLKTTFKSIDINTSYAPVKIYGLVPTAVEVQGKYFSAKLGDDFISKFSDKSNNGTHIKGYKISERTNSTIKIVSKYGDVYIK